MTNSTKILAINGTVRKATKALGALLNDSLYGNKYTTKPKNETTINSTQTSGKELKLSTGKKLMLYISNSINATELPIAHTDFSRPLKLTIAKTAVIMTVKIK